ncbi:hypothetical protein IE53DRAFT_69453 [Violaceomyces palustris]|uniref:Uncharacterized protein n=1 Tax=Violaceomyces palustris TaxID=1673888 RepID=A0ACD0NYM1_9BASI|nr:hypothetical protein IE53DRAFT_69453 [Violaceomyces palustris]
MIRCLTETLLLHDFGLHVHLPEHRLCPTVPNRLNYLSWAHGILDSTLPLYEILEGSSNARCRGRTEVRALDIGTGASAIYPILGCAVDPSWSFTATDIDDESLRWASKIVREPLNNLSFSMHGHRKKKHLHLKDRIRLLHRKVEDPLIPPRSDIGVPHARLLYHLTMCNPPFYSSEEEMRASYELKEQEPSAVCHGTENEMITEGGEVNFVKRMVEESMGLWESVILYSSMLGKLSSLRLLVEHLRERGVGNYAIGELIQGQTRRWVLGWSHTPYRIAGGMSSCKSLALARLLPSATMRSMSFDLSSDEEREEVLIERLKSILVGLGSSEFIQTQGGGGDGKSDHLLEVKMMSESWTRSARRARTRRQKQGEEEEEEAAGGSNHQEPLLCVRFSLERFMNGDDDDEERVGSSSRATKERRRLISQWIYGRDRIKFESLTGHVFQRFEDSLRGKR